MATSTTVSANRLIQQLPVFSPVAIKLMILVTDEDVSYKEVAQLFSLDPVLAGQILKLANSGLYGRQVAIQSVLQAVAMLGLKNISRIAITAALTTGFLRPVNPWIREWWRHSVASALIADQAGKGSLDLDYGYTAGLLHAVGRLALFRHAPNEYPRLLEQARLEDANPIAYERKRFGTDHGELTSLILAKWGLPNGLQRAIAQHHRADASDPLAAAVHAGCFYADSMGFGRCGCCASQLPEAASRGDRFADYLRNVVAIEVNRLEIDCAVA